LETKKYGKIMDLAVDQNTKVSLIRLKFKHTKFRNFLQRKQTQNAKQNRLKNDSLDRNNLPKTNEKHKTKQKRIWMEGRGGNQPLRQLELRYQMM